MINAAEAARRMNTIGGTDMKILMSGNAPDIHRLWQEKTGQALPDDMTEVWPVRRGQATEALNIEWFERKQRHAVIRRGEVVRHAFLPWATVTLDGWIETLQCPLECKDVGGHETLEVVIERYQPQMQWQCEVTGADQVALSLIVAGREPVVDFIERNAAYAAQMIEVGEMFMAHVRNKTPPVDLPEVPPPAIVTRIVDMQGNNEWGNWAGLWLHTRGAVEDNTNAAKMLKALVPADAKKCVGHGVYITRNRAGTLSLREDRDE